MNKPTNHEFDLPTRPSILSEQTFSSQSHRSNQNPSIDHQERVKKRSFLGKKSILLLALLFIVIAAGLVVYNVGLQKIQQQIPFQTNATIKTPTQTATSPAALSASNTPSTTTSSAPSSQDAVTQANISAAESKQLSASPTPLSAETEVVEEISDPQATSEKPKKKAKKLVKRQQTPNPLLGSLLSPPAEASVIENDDFTQANTVVSAEESVRMEMANALYIKGYQQEHINKRAALKHWQNALEQAPVNSDIYQKIAHKIAIAKQDISNTSAQF